MLMRFLNCGCLSAIQYLESPGSQLQDTDNRVHQNIRTGVLSALTQRNPVALPSQLTTMTSRLLFGAIVVFAELGLLYGQVCENVYPHLSCGLSHKTESSCVSSGGCWDGTSCFVPKIYGYEYTSTSEDPYHMKGTLSLNEPSGLKFGTDFAELGMEVIQETESRTHIKISPTGVKRWEIPEDILPRPTGVYSGSAPQMKTTIKPQNDDDQYDNMEILISRLNHNRPTAEVIFAFTKMLVFQDQYLQFVLGVPNDVAATYGFGESTRHTQRLTYNSTYTLWNTDQASSNFEQSLYGSHPFYLQVTSDGKAHGVLFLNSNGMDVTVTESATQGNTIGVQSTGGLIDIYVFAGPTPGDVVRQYLEVVGRPAMVPYWSLGFHNCRWGYENIQYVEEVVANYSAAGIPLETQWTDIDYMDGFKDFTFSPENFPLERVQEFVKTLHANGQRYVPIVDPAIYVLNTTYSAYTEGMKLDVFVKDLYGKEPYLSQVWPGETYFPDWFAPNAQAYWTAQMEGFYEQIAFDGIWIDMNEASNFCNADGNGQVCELWPNSPCPNGCCINCSTVDATNKYDYPPFVPNVVWGALGAKTIASSAVHAGGVLEYDAHNLYGLMESIATREALLAIRPAERPFVLSRSTSMGSGRHAAHWTGDNAATWDDLKASIITINNLALFGLSVTGADICGFNGASWEELCARWIEVGAFSPFSRDHNAIGQPPQELYRWDTVAEASRKALSLRYQLLPYLYTLIYNAHAHGDLVMRGLWVNYPADPVTLAQDGQYMWADGLLFTPVLDGGVTSVTGYFPKGVWYSLTDDSVIDATAAGKFVTLATDLTSTNVHVRGGRIIPMQEAAMTTTKARATPFTLLVALDADGTAEGSLFLDDGVQAELSRVTTVTFTARDGVLRSSLDQSLYASDALLGKVVVRGVVGDRANCRATLRGQGSAVAVAPASVKVISGKGHASTVEFTFDAAAGVKVASAFEHSWTCL